MIGIKEVGIKKVIKIRNGTLVVVYDDKTGLISIDSGDLGDINCNVGGCINANVMGGINGDVLVGINGNIRGLNGNLEGKVRHDDDWTDIGNNMQIDKDGSIINGLMK